MEDRTARAFLSCRESRENWERKQDLGKIGYLERGFGW